MISYWIMRWTGGLDRARSDWERFLIILETEFMQMIARLAVFSVFKGLANVLSGGTFGEGFEQGIKSFFGIENKFSNLNVPAIAGANLNIIVSSGQNQQLERILNRLQNLETKINISINNQINQQVETDWVKIRTGINTANYRKFSKTL
jgi:hypothetical protein